MVLVPDYLLSKEKARQQYDAAFHLLHVTYPMVNDPKLLIGIISNLFSTLESSMEMILKYERQLQLVPNYPDSFKYKLDLFCRKSVRRNNIPHSFIHLILELKDTLELHKQTPMAFQRGNRLVLCNKEYSMKVLSLKTIKEFLDKSKEFLELSERIVKLR